MIEMNVSDREFAALLARWASQSVYSAGVSGGRTKFDGERGATDSPLASMKPYACATPFAQFDKAWKKQPYFEHARPFLGMIFSALAAKFGKDFGAYANAARNWYRIGTFEAKRLAPAIKKLVESGRPLILFGRDCLPLYRAMYGLCPMVYAEGLSRHLVRGIGSQDYTNRYLYDLLEKQFPMIPAVDALTFVDTGFAGTIPLAAWKAMKIGRPGPTGSIERRVDSYSMSPPSVCIRMLSASNKEWDLGVQRDKVVKTEYKPKVFWRAMHWIQYTTYDTRRFAASSHMVPELRVSGDAVNAAAMIVGIMAATAEARYNADCRALP